MRSITGLPCVAQIPMLQKGAQLNHLIKPVQQRRGACHLRLPAILAAAAVAYFLDSSLPLLMALTSNPPGWLRLEVTDIRPLTRLRHLHLLEASLN